MVHVAFPLIYLDMYYAPHKKSRTCVHTYITSKRIELESPCWSGFEAFRIFFKTCATGAF